MTETGPTMTMRFGGLNDDGPGTDDDWMRVAPDNGNLKEVVPGRDEARVDPRQRVVLREPTPAQIRTIIKSL